MANDNVLLSVAVLRHLYECRRPHAGESHVRHKFLVSKENPRSLNLQMAFRGGRVATILPRVNLVCSFAPRPYCERHAPLSHRRSGSGERRPANCVSLSLFVSHTHALTTATFVPTGNSTGDSNASTSRKSAKVGLFLY